MPLVIDERQLLDEHPRKVRVALVMGEQGTEHVEHLIDQRRARHGLERDINGAARLLAEDHDEEVLLAAGVNEDRADPDVGGPRDLAGGGGRETLAREEGARGALDAHQLVELLSLDAAKGAQGGGGGVRRHFEHAQL